MPKITITTNSIYETINVSNVQAYLDELPPENITIINVSKCKLTHLSNLSKFTNLKGLYCSCNQLITLPELPNSLRELNCYRNQLTTLPALPEWLVLFDCARNQLITLPALPASLITFDCSNNPISGILKDLSVNNTINILLTRSTINKLNRFRHVYYILKFKIKFIQWFLRANERKIMEKNHPDKIIKLLNSGVDVLKLHEHL